MGMFFVSMPRQCLNVIRSWTKFVKWAKSPGQTPGPDGQTDMPEWVQPPPPQVNAKCDVVMKLSVFGTRTDTHTYKAKPTHPRYAGCNK